MGGASAAPKSPGAVTGPDSTPRRAFNSLAVTAHDQPMKQGVLNSILVRLGDRSPHRALAPTSHLTEITVAVQAGPCSYSHPHFHLPHSDLQGSHVSNMVTVLTRTYPTALPHSAAGMLPPSSSTQAAPDSCKPTPCIRHLTSSATTMTKPQTPTLTRLSVPLECSMPLMYGSQRPLNTALLPAN